MPCLTLDAGGLLFKTPRLSPHKAEQDKATAEGIASAYDLMGFDAVGITANDLAGGLDFLLELNCRTKFTLLSANLVHKDTGKPIFTPYLIRKVNDLNVGIFGLTSPTAASLIQDKDNAAILSWEKSLPDLLVDLRPKTDLIILLSSLLGNQNDEIAQAYPDIHLIIQAGKGGGNQNPLLRNNTLICQTNKQGKYLGMMEINWCSSHAWEVKKVELLKGKTNEIDSINWQLRRLQNSDKRENESAEVKQIRAAHLKQLQEKQKNLAAEIERLKKEIEKGGKENVTPSTYANKFITMAPSLPDHLEVLNLVGKIKKRVNEIGKATLVKGKNLSKQSPQTALDNKDRASSVEVPLYTGTNSCASCHPSHTDSWARTPHAQAYQTLVDKGQQFNLDCLPCHVTGVMSGKEPYALILPNVLQSVGCEVCHGPGKQHVSNPNQMPLVRQPEPDNCIRCHTEERDGSFNYVEKIKRAGHMNSPT